jgi:hypothetical protein
VAQAHSLNRGQDVKSYNQQHEFYCGIDLHANSMHDQAQLTDASPRQSDPQQHSKQAMPSPRMDDDFPVVKIDAEGIP